MTTVSCVELAPSVGDLAANQELILESLASATAHGADIVVLPELATSGYVFESAAEARSCALAIDDARLTRWSAALPQGAVAVIGFAELGSSGELFNSAAIIDANGLLAAHRKVHLWDREQLFFEPGRQRPPVVDTPAGRIAAMVCYDLEFPEYTRTAALAGAELLAVPTNWPRADRPAHERPAEVIIAQAAARVNRMAVACCDRSGTERGQEWTSGTAIIGCDGWLLTEIGGDQSAQLDLSDSRDKRLSVRNDLFGDRRIDVYEQPS